MAEEPAARSGRGSAGSTPSRGPQKPDDPAALASKHRVQTNRLRLSYALAAAHLHRSLQTTEPERRTALRAAQDHADTAVRDAETLQEESTSPAAVRRAGILGGYAWAQVVNTRLDTFLKTVYIPTARVLRAGALMELAFTGEKADLKAPDREVNEIRSGQPPYRTRYNVACYLASKAMHLGEPELKSKREMTLLGEAYSELEATLFAAPPGEQARLAARALLDPSLAALRVSPTMRTKHCELLALFAKVTKPSSDHLVGLEGLDQHTTDRLKDLGVVTLADVAKLGWQRLHDEMPPWTSELIELALLGPLSLADVNALYRLGLRGIGDLKGSEPADLAARLTEIKPAGLTDWKAPGLATVDHWVMAARRASISRG